MEGLFLRTMSVGNYCDQRESLKIGVIISAFCGRHFSVPTRFFMAVGGVDLSFIGEGEEDMDFGARLMSFLSGAFVVPEAGPSSWSVRTRANAADIEKRTSRAEQRFKDRRSLIVNDGMGYWKNTDWEQYVR